MRHTLLCAVISVTALSTPAFVGAQDSSTAESPVADRASADRVGADIRYLASDELEGRGPMTKGLELAAQHMEECFRSEGLKGGGKDGSYRLPFSFDVDTKAVKDKTTLVLSRGEVSRSLAIGKDFQPLAAGGSGSVEADAVFVGYGISAADLDYDEYSPVDVEGKVVILIRREPQQADDKSVFKGKQTSSHAFVRTKINAAKKAKAAAIIMVNDPYSTKDQDPLAGPGAFGSNGAGIPYFHLKQSKLDEMLALAPIKAGDKELLTVAQIAAHIDEKLEPLSQAIGWKVKLECQFETVKANVANVIGVLDGEGPLADETIVIGAHYDHLGRGPFGSRRPKVRAVHNGADDNATGTAAVMELARRFARAKTKPARRMVFIGFTAEERGVLGSADYVKSPPFPLEKTVAMINFDMIGMYKDQGITLGGVATSSAFPGVLDRATESLNLNLKQTPSVGGSDHMGFYQKGVPVLFFHTGLTDFYHTPEDDFETIDVNGTVLTIDLAEQMIAEVAKLQEAPKFTKVTPNRRQRAVVYLGIVPDFDATSGVGVAEVAKDSPAEKSGMQAGDLILKLDDKPLKSFNELPRRLGQYKVGDPVKVTVKRGDEEKVLEVKLAGPPN